MAYQMDAADGFEAGCKGPVHIDGDTQYIVWRGEAGAWALVAYDDETQDHTVLTEEDARQILDGRFNRIDQI